MNIYDDIYISIFIGLCVYVYKAYTHLFTFFVEFNLGPLEVKRYASQKIPFGCEEGEESEKC